MIFISLPTNSVFYEFERATTPEQLSKEISRRLLDIHDINKLYLKQKTVVPLPQGPIYQITKY